MNKKENKIFNKKNVLGLFIVIIMASSIFGIWQSTDEVLEEYNGHMFKSTETGVFGKIDDKWVKFSYHPSSIESINVSSTALTKLRDSKMIYLTFDPDDKMINYIELARLNFAEQLNKEFNVYTMVGTTSNTTPYSTFPIINCTNATQLIPVVYLKSGEVTGIFEENNCIMLSAAYEMDFNALLDRIRYTFYDVMNATE